MDNSPLNRPTTMMAKATTSTSIRSLLSYCLRVAEGGGPKGKKPRILLSNLCPPVKNVRALQSCIQGANDMRNTKRIHHIVMAHPNRDAHLVAKIGEEQLIRELIEGLKEKGINLDDAPYVVIAHTDKANHIDYHLIAASTDLNGKAIKDSYIGSRAMKIANDLSKKYGLSENNEKKKEREKKKEKAQKIEIEEPKIEVAKVEAIDIEIPEMKKSEPKELSEIKMGKDVLEEEKRAEEAEKARKKKIVEEWDKQVQLLELNEKEKVRLIHGEEIGYSAGRRIGGYTNDRNITLRAEMKPDRVTIKAIVEGVAMDIYQFFKELTERIRIRNDKRQQKSSQDRQGRGRKM